MFVSPIKIQGLWSRDLVFFTIISLIPRRVCNVWLVLNRYLSSECMHASGGLWGRVWGNGCCLGVLKAQFRLDSILWSFSNDLHVCRRREIHDTCHYVPFLDEIY